MKNFWYLIGGAVIFLILGFGIGWYVYSDESTIGTSPFIFEEQIKQYPYKKYTFSALQSYDYQPREIEIGKEIKKEDAFTSYEFSYTPLGKKMTGQVNIPTEVTADTPVIIMIRGFVPAEIFSTGTGTRNGAAEYAKAGFITLAPDFFGYGDSEPEPEDSWQARFEKPIIIIELIKSIEELGIPIPNSQQLTTNHIGLWGHSNGGHIALSVLEITKQPYPTALWAPVTAPFPYSVLFFTDEDEDEGKGMRLWIHQLEKDYELRDFSITQYLGSLLGPIQLHHGTADEAALEVWSEEFLQKIEKENDRREFIKEQYEESASESAKANDPFLQPVNMTYYQYPGADHNMQPSWNTVVERDITFFTEHLKPSVTLLEKELEN